ncbi:MAG: hypothetical protein RR914_06405 [Oscillospiraceae bacterium]
MEELLELLTGSSYRWSEVSEILSTDIDTLSTIRDDFFKALKSASENAQKNTVSKDADGEVKWSIENIGDKFYVKQERKVISGNDSNEWRNQVYNHINRSVRRG